MLLRDHSVRGLIHTSPPWDVLQASPSVSIRQLEVGCPSLNPKMHLVPITIRSLHPKLSHFAHFSLFPTLMSPHSYLCPSYLVQFDSIQHRWLTLLLNRPAIIPNALNSSPTPSQWLEIIATPMQFAPTQPKCSECASNLPYMCRIHRNSTAICLKAIQMSLDSSLLVTIQLNMPQIVSKCCYMSPNCLKSQ